MCEIEAVVHIITKMYIIINATRLGWAVEVQDNKLVLSKHSTKLTRLDKNTPKLIDALIQDSWIGNC
jgi:hypothetical protein